MALNVLDGKHEHLLMRLSRLTDELQGILEEYARLCGREGPKGWVWRRSMTAFVMLDKLVEKLGSKRYHGAQKLYKRKVKVPKS